LVSEKKWGKPEFGKKNGPFCPWGLSWRASLPFKALGGPPKRFKSLWGMLGPDGWRKSLRGELRAFCAKGRLGLGGIWSWSWIWKKWPFLLLDFGARAQLSV